MADDKGHEKLTYEIKGIGTTNYKLKSLVWVNFPLVYTQTVLMVSWCLYALLLFSSQYIDPDATSWKKIDSTTGTQFNPLQNPHQKVNKNPHGKAFKMFYQKIQ